MRIWTLHPRYLDARGLVAAWREGLLAQKVLAGETRGYRRHPQLERFWAQPDPLAAIGAYLVELAAEAARRRYSFDTSRIRVPGPAKPLPATDGQVRFEWFHLMQKLAHRDADRARAFADVTQPELHPLFARTAGPVASWERIAA